MSRSLFELTTMGDALRNTGYKSIESAVAEIIDNSIEAQAHNIAILISEKLDEVTGVKKIDEIAFIDDGSGMNIKKLEDCLGIGATTKSDRRGMGRFGVGLPQASLFACPSIDVYSWQNGYENCHKVYLDINKISAGEQIDLPDPVKCDIPIKYQTYLQYNVQNSLKNETCQLDFKKSGTLVVWKKYDQKPRTYNALIRRLKFELGKTFRYFISNNDVNIYVIKDEDEKCWTILPNDPLFLMQNNLYLGKVDDPEHVYTITDSGAEPFFRPYCSELCPDGIVRRNIKYYDPVTREKKESEVQIKFSIVKDEFYDLNVIPKPKNPGRSDVGKCTSKLVGISIVRANREIDFGEFGYYSSINKPNHRWWGCEISFNPTLDEVFGVANNKQYVDLKKIDDDDIEEYKQIEKIDQPIWLQLKHIVADTISNMFDENQSKRRGSRTTETACNPTIEIINDAEEDNSQGESQEPSELEEREIDEEIKGIIEDDGHIPTEADIDLFKQNKVNIFYRGLTITSPFISYKFNLGTCLIYINKDHPFYKDYLADFINDQDSIFSTAFELWIGALVKAIDETNITQSDENNKLILLWEEKLRKYLERIC